MIVYRLCRSQHPTLGVVQVSTSVSVSVSPHVIQKRTMQPNVAIPHLVEGWSNEVLMLADRHQHAKLSTFPDQDQRRRK